MDAMIVVDMQEGLLQGKPKHDLDGVMSRINTLTRIVRSDAGQVIWIQHCGNETDGFEPGTSGWEFLPQLERQATDLIVAKSLNDPFTGTDLQATLENLRPDRVLVAGWATDFCVDATVRSCVSNNHHVVAIGDAHTLSDRPHLDAQSVIRHHNWVWSGLITRRSVRVATTTEILTGHLG